MSDEVSSQPTPATTGSQPSTGQGTPTAVPPAPGTSAPSIVTPPAPATSAPSTNGQGPPPGPPGGGGPGETISNGRTWISTLGAIVLGIGFVLLLIVFGVALRNQNNVVGLDPKEVAIALQQAREEVTDARSTVTQMENNLTAAKTAASKAASEKNPDLIKAQGELDKAEGAATTARLNLDVARVKVLVLEDRGKALSWWSTREADLAAIGFLFTMLGLLLLFPGLLSDGTKAVNDEIPISTMRFAVLMVVMLFVVITFKAAWVVGLDNLEVSTTWAWILAIAFGGKVGQSGIEWFAQRGGSGTAVPAAGQLAGPAATPVPAK